MHKGNKRHKRVNKELVKSYKKLVQMLDKFFFMLYNLHVIKQEGISPKELKMKDLQNVTIYDNGACFMIQVNGLQVKACSSLGEAWKYIVGMYRVASQQFTVGEKEIPVTDWIDGMTKAGYLD